MSRTSRQLSPQDYVWAEAPLPMDRRPFHEYEDLSFTPAYVLGYAFHGLGLTHAKSSVHGRLGVLALLDELFATLHRLKLQDGLRASESLLQLRNSMAPTSRSSRLGSSGAAEVTRALLVLEAAVQLDLRARAESLLSARVSSSGSHRLFGETAGALCPDGLRFDVGEADRAFAAQLVTAGVFHLFRVWDGLHARPSPVLRPDGSMVPDPRVPGGVPSSESDAAILVEAIRRHLEGKQLPPG